MKKIHSKFLGFIVMLLLPWSVFSQSSSWSVKNEELQDHWQIQSSKKVFVNGGKISTLNFKPSNWYAAKVPNSTLGT
ncbi:MAG TPA: hypothetical protein VLS85_00740, partial [Hanamia sp.]|nr:hypothetical protein [Hanamia sp.]